MQFKSIFPILVVWAILSSACRDERFINDPGNLVPKTVEQDPSISSIYVNNSLLHSEAFGNPDSPLVVCIHGGPGADYRYMLNCKDLANHGYRVVFYDQRGSGLSQRFPLSSYTDLGKAGLNIMYDELAAVIKHYKTHPTQKVLLLGHSWGAMLATGFAGGHPNEVQGLAVCEPGGLKWDDIVEYVKKSRSFKIWGELLNDVTYLDQFITGRKNDHEILDYKLAILASNNSITGESNIQPEGFWRSGAVVNAGLFKIGQTYKTDLSEGIGNFKVPVQFFYSELNKAYPTTWANKITAVYNTVNLKQISGVGHDGIINNRAAWEQQTLPQLLTYFNSL